MCRVKKEWINSLGLKWSIKNICYMDFTSLVGDLCYSSKLFFFSPLLWYEDRQWLALSICQGGIFSVKELTGLLSAGTREHSCSYEADRGPAFLWVENIYNGGSSGRDGVMLGYIKAPQLHACVICLCPSTDHGLSIWALCNNSPNEAEGRKGQEVTQTSDLLSPSSWGY